MNGRVDGGREGGGRETIVVSAANCRPGSPFFRVVGGAASWGRQAVMET